jgi:hypothetical protein
MSVMSPLQTLQHYNVSDVEARAAPTLAAHPLPPHTHKGNGGDASLAGGPKVSPVHTQSLIEGGCQLLHVRLTTVHT